MIKNKQYIKKKAFWLSQNGKIWCVGEYIFLQILLVSFFGWWMYFITSTNQKSEFDWLILNICMIPAIFCIALSLTGIVYYKSYVWPCLFIWRFFKPKIGDLRKAILDKRIRYEYVRETPGGYYRKVAVQY